MRPRSILVHLLLCLALLANGTTAAFANARMAFEGAAVPTAGHAAPTAAHDDAAAPCHDMAAMEQAATAHHATPAGSSSHSDCCPPGACLCNCVSQGAAILTVHALALAALRSLAPTVPPHVSIASPALQHPIRPPIG